MKYIEAFREGDKINEVYLCKYKQAATAVDLLQQTGLMEHICGAFQPEMTWEEYEAYRGAEFGG